MKITYLGHACFTIEAGGVKLLVDPFLKHNPNYCDALWEQAARPDYILVTHGHGDHVGDTIEIAARSGATLISNFEICNWLHAAGVERFIDLNPGGTATLADGGVTVTMTPAIHSSSMASEGGDNIYGGLACGFVIRCGAEAVYYAGDTCLFGDMRLVDELYKPTVGLLPIGGKYTMDAEAAAYACNNFFNFRTVIPMHYDTFPPISADPARFSALVKKGAVRMLALGEALEI